MALDLGPVGIWGYGLWPGNDDAAEAVAELDELGYGALWLGSSDGGLELHEALLAASRRLVLATAIINIWVDPPARVAASYQRVERAYPGRILIGLGSSHEGMTQGQKYRPYPRRLRLRFAPPPAMAGAGRRPEGPAISNVNLSRGPAAERSAT